MEDTLRACKAVRLVLCEVLILVVMEDTLRALTVEQFKAAQGS